MVIQRGHKAWRTSPCKFYAQHQWCTKGDDCPFAHLDADGRDVHNDPLDTHEIEGQTMSEGQETAPDHGTFDEDQADEVGEGAETYEEEEEDSGERPHVGPYFGIVLYYASQNYFDCFEIQYNNRKIRTSTPRRKRDHVYFLPLC